MGTKSSIGEGGNEEINKVVAGRGWRQTGIDRRGERIAHMANRGEQVAEAVGRAKEDKIDTIDW